ncbi:MAG: hypothetical protein HY944_02705 [Gemmatimonadetes bacterium]|nr:hypothetical protein [Gemmatimonadota bacterium]
MKRFFPLAALLIAAACSDEATPFAPATEPESASLMSRSAAATASKVAVCHVDELGAYKLINISVNAKKAHLAHGDGQPGEGGFSAACTLSADPFVFASVSSTFFEESFYFINWTVQGSPNAVSFDVQIYIPPSGLGGIGSWSTLESVVGTGPAAYTSVEAYGAGTYRIVATLSDASTVESASIIIP